MILNTKQLAIKLEQRGIVPIQSAIGIRIDCLRGRLWITEPGAVDDIVLEAGESYVISGNGVALVQALREALVGLHTPVVGQDGCGIAAWTRRIWSEWAAGAPGGHAVVQSEVA